MILYWLFVWPSYHSCYPWLRKRHSAPFTYLNFVFVDVDRHNHRTIVRFIDYLFKGGRLHTLESGIDVGQGINVGPGIFVKKNKRRVLTKPRENIWNCSRKYSKMFKTDSFLSNKKLSFNQNVWRDHATKQQFVLLHFWVIFLY